MQRIDCEHFNAINVEELKEWLSCLIEEAEMTVTEMLKRKEEESAAKKIKKKLTFYSSSSDESFQSEKQPGNNLTLPFQHSLFAESPIGEDNMIPYFGEAAAESIIPVYPEEYDKEYIFGEEEKIAVYPEITDEDIKSKSSSSESMNFVVQRKDRFPLRPVWSFGFSTDVNIEFLEEGLILMASAHFGVVYNYIDNTMQFLPGQSNKVTNVAGQNTMVVTGEKGENAAITLWDRTTLQTVRKWHLSLEGIKVIRFSPNGKYIIFAYDGPPQGRIQRWHLSDFRDVAAALFPEGCNIIIDVSFNEKNMDEMLVTQPEKVFIVHGKNKTSELFHVKLNNVRGNNIGDFVGSIFLTKYKQIIAATTAGKLTVWHTSGRHIKNITIDQKALGQVLLIKELIVTTSNSGTIWFHDQQLRLLHWYKLNNEPINFLSFNIKDPTNGFPNCIFSSSGRVILTNPQRAEYQHITTPSVAIVTCIACNSFGWQFASGDESGRIAVYSITEKTLINDRMIATNAITALTYSPDGKLLLSGTKNGSVFVVNADLEIIQTVEPAKMEIKSIKFSFSGTSFLYTYFDAGVQLIKKTMKWVPRGKIIGHCNKLNDLALNKYSAFSVGDDRYLTAYDIRYSLRVVTRVKIEDLAIPLCCICHENKLLIANSYHNVRIWDIEKLQCENTFKGVFLAPMELLCLENNCLFCMCGPDVGITQLPFEGVSRTVKVHPTKVKCIAVNKEFIFTVGENSTEILMWQINYPFNPPQLPSPPNYIEQAIAKFFSEDDRMECSDVIDNLRLLGYFPTPFDVQLILNKINEEPFVSQQQFISIYMNYKPAHGATVYDLQQAFRTVGKSLNMQHFSIKTQDFIQILGGEEVKKNILTCLQTSDETKDLPQDLTCDYFIDSILGVDHETLT